MKVDYKIDATELEQIEGGTSQDNRAIEFGVLFENTPDWMTISFPVKAMRKCVTEKQLNVF